MPCLLLGVDTVVSRKKKRVISCRSMAKLKENSECLPIHGKSIPRSSVRDMLVLEDKRDPKKATEDLK